MEPLIKPEFPYFHSDGVIAKMKLASIRYEDKDRVVVRFDDRYALSLENAADFGKAKIRRIGVAKHDECYPRRAVTIG